MRNFDRAEQTNPVSRLGNVEMFDSVGPRIAAFLIVVFLAFFPISSRGSEPRFTEEILAESGTFILPNETRTSVYYPVNRGMTGALISVGTYRALAAASQGRFSAVVLFDTDRKVVEFNRLQVEALKTSATVEEFLSKLKKEHSSGSPYVEKLTNKIRPRDNQTSFLTNPVAYDRIRKLALEGRIYIVAGDLAGERTLSEVGKFLRTQRVSVDVIDISNAFYYFFSKREKVEAFIANLDALPFSKRGVVNFTDTVASPHNLGKPNPAYFQKFKVPGEIMQWGYYSLPISDFVTNAKLIGDKQVSYPRFLTELHATPADMNVHLRFTCRTLFVP